MLQQREHMSRVRQPVTSSPHVIRGGPGDGDQPILVVTRWHRPSGDRPSRTTGRWRGGDAGADKGSAYLGVPGPRPSLTRARTRRARGCNRHRNQGHCHPPPVHHITLTRRSGRALIRPPAGAHGPRASSLCAAVTYSTEASYIRATFDQHTRRLAGEACQCSEQPPKLDESGLYLEGSAISLVGDVLGSRT